MQDLPIFYINLDHRRDRRDFIEAGLERLGLSAQRFPAVKPSDLDPAIVARSSLVLVHRACTESHLTIWRHMIAHNIQAAVILEDDVQLSASLPEFLRWPALREPWYDVIKLETRLSTVWLASRQARQAPSGVAVRRLMSQHLGTAGYIITLPTVKALLDSPILDAVAIDRVLFSHNDSFLYSYRVFQTQPGLCVPEEFCKAPDPGLSRSDIGTQPKRRRRGLRNPFREFYRKARLFGLFYGKFGTQGLLVDAQHEWIGATPDLPVAAPAYSPLAR